VSIPTSHSLVQLIPAISSVLKEQLHDLLVARHANPTRDNILPQVGFLRGTLEPLCVRCTEEHQTPGDETSATFHDAQTPYLSDVPQVCFVCEQRLDVVLSREGAEAVIAWSTQFVHHGNTLTDTDWLDVWLSTRDLPHADPLWDHISFLISSL